QLMCLPMSFMREAMLTSYRNKTSYDQRRAALKAFGDVIEANQDALARLMTMEQGKPLTQANMEVGLAATWARQIPDIEIPENASEDTDERRIVQRYTPIGVAAAIVPWNFPLLLAVGKIVPAVYTGNTIVVKPSPFTPYCALKLAELATKCFLPGVVQAVGG